MNTSGFATWNLTRKPRAWQSSALEAWRKEFHGIVSVVTGAGKTTFAQMCMLEFRDTYPDARFVIIVPTLALLDQWYVSLREDLLVPAESIAVYSGEGRPEESKVINLMVVNTARTYARGVSDLFDTMVIVDECHRAASPVNAAAISGSHLATLGMSATPERQYDDLFHTVLVPALGPIIFRYDYNQALQDETIVPFELINVLSEMTPSEQRQYEDATRDIARSWNRDHAGGTDSVVLNDKLQRRAQLAASSMSRIPVAVRLAEQHRESRLILFHESIKAAEEILKLLSSRGFDATIYHSRVGADMRRDNLRLYRRRVFNALVTCRALDEGVNVPDTSVAIIASSSTSIRQRIQRMGRVLRPAPGKGSATVYTIYTTKLEEERLAREALDLEDSVNVAWMQASVGRDGPASN